MTARIPTTTATPTAITIFINRYPAYGPFSDSSIGNNRPHA